ncbi:branched-chain amino acid ABC transporter permease [Bradyrhizobium sp. U87765 SZCCT0131]|uniref:branched-chain amino acid ABC transporter permease n=1 Tax=unclassified Bradyrhizobium TaxID=2631580 RepID=UPI001BA64B3E|nr:MULTISPECIES: branched-chain amino acid ABC transporter permease [unclassified Bradyrhizobium]MBR1220536.1 branched-chain amino acid ABC transporter permease [Bradyrhizobium sp. U87765 SZCCT0131]MBR1263009.1 branched-chain amino acid ABC transporter permease [Bradyrhizobium sp. U87765 SZCCT0134]MBR1307108.1 branched-chain amino acid ABC transporter permease [Bradyrhizobium sp. U87765 SZCCT0110]MBR1323004.1 branched-chain amino acid ABC transporter permease [Bradyrhizobium sp. U87765 SZCCT010
MPTPVGLALAVAAVAVVLPLALPSAALATECLIFAMAALGCNLLLGRVGLLSFGQAIFFGAGSYCAGILLIRYDVGLIAALAAAVVLAGLLGAAIDVIATQRHGIYFIMLTLALTQMAFFLCYAASDLTGGDNGLLNVPRPDLSVLGHPLVSFAQPLQFYAFVAVVCVGVFFLFARLVDSPFGATLVAIRDNEDRAIAIGYDVRRYKILSLVLSAAVTGLAGALYAMALKFVPLANVDLAMSERIIVMTILGGTGTLFGPMLGSVAVVVLSYVLSDIWARWQIVLGALLVLVAFGLRGGLSSLLDPLFRKRSGEGEAQPAALAGSRGGAQQ